MKTNIDVERLHAAPRRHAASAGRSALRTVALVVAAGVVLASCTKDTRRYPLAEPLWEDQDRNALAQTPADYYSGINGDGLDKLLLRPLSHAFTFQRPGEAVNVNAIDEVPNSSWFQNRIGLHDISPERGARAECGDVPSLDPARGPWTVSKAKPNGANPGFFIKAPDGYSYLLKFDGTYQPLRATASDVIGSKLYWLVGYHSVCNEVVYFDPKILEIGEGATAENEIGDKLPITREAIDKVLAKGFRTKNGLLRASASRFVPGKPLGPFRYEDTRSDDPNDVILHEDRRELRGAFLLAGWINHVDAREQNTFDVVVEEDGRYYIRHYKIDWGDGLGFGFNPDHMARRFGHSYAVDVEQAGEDLVTLGLLDRPWHHVKRSETEVFGYFDVESFTPSKWRGVYAIPAFERRTPRDVLWMVRILSRITDDHIRAIVDTAKLPDERQVKYLTETLIGRRDKFFSEYLTQYAPLATFTLVRRTPGSPRQSLCFEDLALKHEVFSADATHYKMRFTVGQTPTEPDAPELGWLQFTPDPQHPSYSCVVLPVGHVRPSERVAPDAPDDDPGRYGVLKIYVHQGPTVLPMGSVYLHFYDLGPERGFRLVGIERPSEVIVPDKYYY